MKTHHNANPVVTIVSAVTFTPWPFEESEVNLKDAWFFSAYDADQTSLHEGPGYALIENDEETLVYLSDGRYVVLEEKNLPYLRAFLETHHGN